MSIWEISERERLPIGILRETGMTSRFYFLLFSFTLQVSACLLACFGTLADFGVLFWGSPTDCWPYSYNVKLECEPVSTLVPLTTTAIFAIHHYFSVELSATKHVHSPDRTPQIELRAMPKPNAI